MWYYRAMGQVDQTDQKQVRIWINAGTRRRLKTEAARQGRTMTDCLGEAVQEWLDSHRVEREMLQWMRQQQQDPAP